MNQEIVENLILELRSQEEKLYIFSINADFSKNISQKNFISYGIETTKNNSNRLETTTCFLFQIMI